MNNIKKSTSKANLQNPSRQQDDTVSKPAYDSHSEESDEGYEDDEFERDHDQSGGESQDVTPIGM